MTEAEEKCYKMALHDCAAALNAMQKMKETVLSMRDEVNALKKETEEKIRAAAKGRVVILPEPFAEKLQHLIDADKVIIKLKVKRERGDKYGDE